LITGLKKEYVLAALFNNTKQQGLGILDRSGISCMTINDAITTIQKNGLKYDYLRGRVMKVDLEKDTFDEWDYDRDNGLGAAENAIALIRDM
jgi:hypothetical protein